MEYPARPAAASPNHPNQRALSSSCSHNIICIYVYIVYLPVYIQQVDYILTQRAVTTVLPYVSDVQFAGCAVC